MVDRKKVFGKIIERNKAKKEEKEIDDKEKFIEKIRNTKKAKKQYMKGRMV